MALTLKLYLNWNQNADFYHTLWIIFILKHEFKYKHIILYLC